MFRMKKTITESKPNAKGGMDFYPVEVELTEEEEIEAFTEKYPHIAKMLFEK